MKPLMFETEVKCHIYKTVHVLIVNTQACNVMQLVIHRCTHNYADTQCYGCCHVASLTYIVYLCVFLYFEYQNTHSNRKVRTFLEHEDIVVGPYNFK